MKKTTLAGLLAGWLATTAAAFAQQPKFEMADVHISPTSHFGAQNFGGVLREGKYVNRDITMLGLIAAAYGVSEDAISGGPGWIGSDLFDIIAKVPDGTTLAKANLMLQSLLADRFKLVIDTGTHPVPRYVLSVGKGGSKLKAASGSGNANCQPIGGPGGPPAPGELPPNIKVKCTSMTGADIAENLHQMAGGYLDHDVIDQTKLEGSFDFDIEWTGRGILAQKGRDGISIFDAVSKQLGLELKLQDVPQPATEVQSVNRKPTPNADGVAQALALPPPRFEEASIKPANPDGPPRNYLLYTGGSQMTAGGTTHSLISMGLQVPPNLSADLIVGVPKSADTNKWEILAKVPSTGEGAPNIVKGRPLPPPLSVGLEMLHGLMIDRFELKTHMENREITVYALTLAGAKPKMTQANEQERSDFRPDPSLPKPAANSQPMIACKNMSMAELAEFLMRQASGYIDHPIVDATGLEGGWDFAIGWTAAGVLRQQPPQTNQPASGDLRASDPSGGISVFDAVQKQLGLKLVKQTHSYPVWVVDHVSEKPID
jgi:uncharacterized protein (TIGR03435 family)